MSREEGDGRSPVIRRSMVSVSLFYLRDGWEEVDRGYFFFYGLFYRAGREGIVRGWGGGERGDREGRTILGGRTIRKFDSSLIVEIRRCVCYFAEYVLT